MYSIYKIIFFSTFLGLFACHKVEPQKAEKEAAPPPKETKQQISIDEFPNQCEVVDSMIKNLEKKISYKNLYKLNTLFKECLDNVSLKTRYAWYEGSKDIYQKIIIDASTQLTQYMTDTYGDREELKPKQKLELYKKLSEDEKFLADHAKEFYLEKFYIGEGEYTFVQHPQYNLDIFAPHFEKADQIFLQQERKEYLGKNYILDAGLSISFDEVANRLLFWEKYYHDYPKHYFSSDAKEYISTYRNALFKGDDNTRVIWYGDNEFTDKEALKAIRKISKSETSSSDLAERFLHLVAEKEKEFKEIRQPIYESDSNDEYDSPENTESRKQLEKFSTNLNKTVDEMIEKTPY
jgi:hypothetical protein